MTTPSPEKLAQLMAREKSRWKQPERRLVESCEINLLRGIWIASTNEMLALQNNFDDMRRAQAAFEEQLPTARDIAFWANDPAAGLPLSLLAETLSVTSDELTTQLFQGMSRDVLALIQNRAPLRCPLCDKRR